jgi:hypothetical protein
MKKVRISLKDRITLEMQNLSNRMVEIASNPDMTDVNEMRKVSEQVLMLVEEMYRLKYKEYTHRANKVKMAAIAQAQAKKDEAELWKDKYHEVEQRLCEMNTKYSEKGKNITVNS